MTKDKQERKEPRSSSEKIAFLNGLNNKTKLILFAVALVLVLIGGIYLKAVVFNNREGQLTTISKSALEKVIEINELSTVDYTYNAIATVYDENDKKGEKVKYYVAYEGLVTVGIDFKKIVIEVDDTEKIIKITLPEVEIHDLTVDMATFDCIFVNDKYNTEKVSQEAYTASKEDLKQRIETENELFELARENAIASIKALFAPWIEQVDEEYKIEVY